MVFALLCSSLVVLFTFTFLLLPVRTFCLHPRHPSPDQRDTQAKQACASRRGAAQGRSRSDGKRHEPDLTLERQAATTRVRRSRAVLCVCVCVCTKRKQRLAEEEMAEPAKPEKGPGQVTQLTHNTVMGQARNTWLEYWHEKYNQSREPGAATPLIILWTLFARGLG